MLLSKKVTNIFRSTCIGIPAIFLAACGSSNPSSGPTSNEEATEQVPNEKNYYAYFTNYYRNDISLCKITADGSFTDCNITATGLFNTPNGININNGFAYITNSNSNEAYITLCKIASDGNLYACTNMNELEQPHPQKISFYKDYAFITHHGGVSSCKISSDGKLSQCIKTGNNDYFSYGISIKKDIAYITNESNNNVNLCKISQDGRLYNCEEYVLPDAYYYHKKDIINDNNFAYIQTNNSVVACKISEDGNLSDCNLTATAENLGNLRAIATHNDRVFIMGETYYNNENSNSCLVSPSGKISDCNRTGTGFSSPHGVTIYGIDKK